MFHSTCIFAVITGFVVSLISLKTCPMLLVKETLKGFKEPDKRLYVGLGFLFVLGGIVFVFIILH